MITRRSFVGTMAAAAAALGLRDADSMASVLAATPEAGSADLTQFVKIAIGTGGHGHTYPGATVPFGMVQLSPDTYNVGWDRCSGYHYSDRSIMGFSHTHLSGTGVGDMLDFLIMPGTGRAKLVPGTPEKPEEVIAPASATPKRSRSRATIPFFWAITASGRN